MLAAAGAELDAGDRHPLGPGRTALHRAVVRGEAAAVRALLAAGADIEARDSTGETALHEAALVEGPEMVAALVTGGASVNARDRDGATPLHRAAVGKDRAAAIDALISSGALVDARDDNGETPLHWAAECGRSAEVVAALLAAGADPDLWNCRVVAMIRRADGFARRHYRALLLVAGSLALWPHAC